MNTSLGIKNPRSGEIDYHITPAGPAEIEAAAQSLRAAQIAWQKGGFEMRSQAMLALASTIEAHQDKVIKALEIDTGRRRMAQMEVMGVIGNIRAWAAMAPRLMPAQDWIAGQMKPQFKHKNIYVPYALVGVISPWNFPMTLSFIDAVPALMAGASVLIKPSEVTPRFADALAPLIAEAGMSDLLRFVQGAGATGAALIDHVDCVCFTGSVPTGRKVAVRAAENLIPANLELGGKDPLIILPGADLEAAVNLALRSSVLATGQACQSIERVYVHIDDYTSFTAALSLKARAAKFNFPNIGQGHIGPFIYDKQAEIVAAQIADAVKKGASLLSGGTIETHGGGRWLAPTVLTHVDHSMDIMREETFGPVIPVMAYETIDEAIALANDTQFGLSGAVFGPDIETSEAIGAHIEAGAISLMDAALTGQYFEAGKQSFKNSGLGPSRMGANGFLRFFRQQAYIANTGAPLTLEDFKE